MGPLRVAQGGRGSKRPCPKIYHIYPTMMKLGTVIPQLKKIQKICKSRDTPHELCRHKQSACSRWKLRNTDTDSILVHNF